MIAYYLAFALCMVSADVGNRCERSQLDMPLKPALLRAISGGAGLFAFGLLIAGFFVAWYSPFVALGCGIVGAAMWHGAIGRHVDPAKASIISGLFGFFLTGLWAFG